MSRILRTCAGAIVALVALWLGSWGLGLAKETLHSRPLEGELRLSAALQQPRSFGTGQFRVDWTPQGGGQLRMSHPHRPYFDLMSTVPGRAFIAAGLGQQDITEARGLFRLRDTMRMRCSQQYISTLESVGSAVVLGGTLHCGTTEESIDYTMRLEALGDRRLELAIQTNSQQVNRVFLTYQSHEEEAFLGFGAQFSKNNLKGTRLPILVSEQGIGRGAQPVTLGANWVASAGGSWHTTYAPVPHYFTSDLRSLFLDQYEPSVFDLRQDDWVQVKVHSHRLVAQLFVGRTPSELVEEFTATTGRMAPLPRWIHQGAIVGLQGGTEAVRNAYLQLKAEGVPISALWLQDWVGQRKTSFGKQLWWNWQLDTEHYPQWQQLVAELAADGVRVLGYVNPFLVDISFSNSSERHPPARNLFAEAQAAGFLVKNPDGTVYLLQNTNFSAGLIDLTHPEAREWLKETLVRELNAAGFSGWMADFGEGLPFDARLNEGSPQQVHNQYPEFWAALNRDVINESPRPEELFFFSRSGFSNSPRVSTLFWLGDQLVTWDSDDGLDSSLTGLLSSGLSGFSLNHSDIGGYTTLPHRLKWLDYRRSEQLLLRWMEINAFTAVFRSHEGNRPKDNVQVYSSQATRSHFKRFAQLYRTLSDYRQTLEAEARDQGLPLVRHPWIHYPDSRRLLENEDRQFLLGSDLFVAPVLVADQTQRRVFLPPGQWVHLWTGQSYEVSSQGLETVVNAPLGHPGVFFRQHSTVGATLTAALETLHPIDGPLEPE